MKPNKSNTCQLCDRELVLTFHHLVPKKFHENKTVLKKHPDIELIHYGIWVCKACHKHIHKTISLKDLAFTYYTLRLLKNQNELARFCQWAAKQSKRIKP